MLTQLFLPIQYTVQPGRWLCRWLILTYNHVNHSKDCCMNAYIINLLRIYEFNRTYLCSLLHCPLRPQRAQHSIKLGSVIDGIIAVGNQTHANTMRGDLGWLMVNTQTHWDPSYITAGFTLVRRKSPVCLWIFPRYCVMNISAWRWGCLKFRELHCLPGRRCDVT